MSKNRGVAYIKPGVVEVRDIADPKFEDPHGRKINHAVILKIVATNICGSDQHMVRGRTTAPSGLVLGHEITGEVIEKGVDVEFLNVGDIVSVPFNVACGRCRTCRAGGTGVCLTVNPGLPGGAYGYVDMGGWIGGQARYVMTPYADFKLLKFPDRDTALAKSATYDANRHSADGLSCRRQGEGRRWLVCIYCGCGTVGLAAAASARILGAAVVMIGDMNKERLAHAKKIGFEPIDLNAHDRLGELVAAVIGEPVVDSFIDAVGFEAKGDGGGEQPAVVLNQAMEVTRYAGSIGIPGLYVTKDPDRTTNRPRKARSRQFRSRLVEIAFLPYRPDAGLAIQSSAHAGDLARSHPNRGRPTRR